MATKTSGGKYEVKYTDKLGKHTSYVSDLSMAPKGATQSGFKPGTAYTNNKHNAPSIDFSPDTPRSPNQGGWGKIPNINTSQPSPQTAQIAPPNQDPNQLGYDQALKNLQGGGLSGNQLALATSSLNNKYKVGLDSVKASGVQAPTSQGEASGMVSGSMPLVQAPDYSPSPEIASSINDPLTMYAQAIADYLQPVKQRDTLVSEYDKFSKSLGINSLNKELLDVNRIMDGTEDDIRSEVTAAAGFATESQVQAMTIGRNKSLLKKAQFIQDQLTSAKDQLNTLVSLSSQDRQFAEQRHSQGLQLLGNMVQIKQSMDKAATDNFRWYAEKAGIDSLYNSTGGDPLLIRQAEQKLGLPSGGLQTAAIQAQKDRIAARTKEDLQLDVLKSGLQTDVLQRESIKANIANTYDQIKNRNNPANKPPSQAQLQIAGYTDRLKESNTIINKLENKFTGTGSYLGQIVPNIFKSSERQQMEQAQRNFINSVLRRESGAAISDSEFDNARKQYFPQPGNDRAVLNQKAANRATVIRNFTRESGTATSNTIIGPDGQEYEFTN